MSRPKSECGVSLVESMVAIFIATIALSSLGAVIFTATVQNKNQGYETTRMIVFAREKMEEMLELDFADTTSLNGSITDATWEKGLTAGGLADVTQEITTCPGAGAAVGYVQFLDGNGIVLSAASCTAITSWGYTRQWTVTDAPGGVANLKQITVAVFAPEAVNSGGQTPWVILTSYKSQ